MLMIIMLSNLYFFSNKILLWLKIIEAVTRWILEACNVTFYTAQTQYLEDSGIVVAV